MPQSPPSFTPFSHSIYFPFRVSASFTTLFSYCSLFAYLWYRLVTTLPPAPSMFFGSIRLFRPYTSWADLVVNPIFAERSALPPTPFLHLPISSAMSPSADPFPQTTSSLHSIGLLRPVGSPFLGFFWDVKAGPLANIAPV